MQWPVPTGFCEYSKSWSSPGYFEVAELVSRHWPHHRRRRSAGRSVAGDRTLSEKGTKSLKNQWTESSLLGNQKFEPDSLSAFVFSLRFWPTWHDRHWALCRWLSSRLY